MAYNYTHNSHRYRYNIDHPEYDLQYNGIDPDESDPDLPDDYPFRDTRPLHWRYPDMGREQPHQGHVQYERNNRLERHGEKPSTRCSQRENGGKSKIPRGPGAIIGRTSDGQPRLLEIEPRHRIIKFKILKLEDFKNPMRILPVFNVKPILIYKKGDTEGYLMLKETFYAAMEVARMKTNPMLRRGLGKIKFEAARGEEAKQVARQFASISNQ